MHRACRTAPRSPSTVNGPIMTPTTGEHATAPANGLGNRVRDAARYARVRAQSSAALTVTLLSMPLTVWAGLDLIGPIGLILGVALDSVVVAAVVVAWRNPTSRRMGASLLVALLSVALVGYHGMGVAALGEVGVLLGGVPLVAALLWHMVIADRAARLAEQRREQDEHARVSEQMAERAQAQQEQAEQRRAALSPELGYEELTQIAADWRQVRYLDEKRQVEAAREQVQHQASMGQMKRRYEAATEEIRMTANLESARIIAELNRFMMIRHAPDGMAAEARALDGSDLAQVEQAPPLGVGFAAGFAAAPPVAHTPVEHAHTVSDQRVRSAGEQRGRSGSDRSAQAAQPGSGAALSNRAKQEQARSRVVAYFAENPGASVSRAARDLGMSRNTVSKYR